MALVRWWPARTGKLRWHSALVLSDSFGAEIGTSIFVVSCGTQRVHCLDIATGAELWAVKQPCLLATPFLHSGLLWVINGADRLTALSIADGSVIATAGASEASPSGKFAGGQGWIAIETWEDSMGAIECYDLPSAT